VDNRFVPPTTKSEDSLGVGDLSDKELRKAFRPLEREGWVTFTTEGMRTTNKYRNAETLFGVFDVLITVAFNTATFSALWWLVGISPFGKLLAEVTSSGWTGSNLWLLGLLLSLAMSSITMHKTSTYCKARFRSWVADKINLDV
jgi:hypothetical protein